MIDEDQLIAPCPDVDYRNLSSQPTPEDFFLLSRVQGVVTVMELCKVSGLGREKTLATVERLLEAGLLHEVDATGRPKAPAASAQPEPARGLWGHESPSRLEPAPVEPSSLHDLGAPLSDPLDDDLFQDPRTRQGMLLDDDDDILVPTSWARVDSDVEAVPPLGGPTTRPPTAPGKPGGSVPVGRAATVEPRAVDPYHAFPTAFADFEFDAANAVPGVDLETQRELAFVHEHLDQIDFYQLFGLTRDANRKEIRTAYFRMSKRFHPDKFFREDPQGLGARVELVFKFVTKAHDTLTRSSKREEYDRALDQLRAHLAQQAPQAQAPLDESSRKRQRAAEMLERRAEQLEQQGDLLRAATEYKKVATLRRDAGALLRAANLLLRANQQLDEAARLARGACQEMPTAVEPRVILGQIYEKNDMFAEAIAAFEEAMELSPGDPAVRVHVERVRSHLR